MQWPTRYVWYDYICNIYLVSDHYDCDTYTDYERTVCDVEVICVCVCVTVHNNNTHVTNAVTVCRYIWTNIRHGHIV